ncbi:MAG: hypothetical protein PHW83_06320, partial [Bacteroidales bacterium]|nr:hypothetical protein [Bacteroidales bacterium]
MTIKLFVLLVFLQLPIICCLSQTSTYLDSLLNISKQYNNYETYFSEQSELGNFYVESGQYEKGLEIYFMLLKVTESKNDSASIALLYNNIATVYRETGKNDLVYKYASMAAELSKYVPNLSHRADIHNTLANYYYENYIDSLALENFNISHNYRLQAGIQKDIAVSWKNLGSIYYELGNTDLALDCMHTSLQIRWELKDTQGIISS